LHGTTEVATDDGFVLTTPSQQWAYAVELPRHESASACRIRLAAKVQTGCLAIGLLSADKSSIVQETQVPATGEWREVILVATPDTGSIMIRNSSQRGPSRAALRISGFGHGATQEPDDESRDIDRPIEVVVDRAPFARFECWHGRIPPGFTANWAGVMTRAAFKAWWPPEDIVAIETERVAEVPPPFDSVLIFDWVPLLEALSPAEGVFRMAAVGAGWGRWLTAGAFLARQRGLDYRLLGVEAEPQHFAWMIQHMDDNGIEPEKRVLLNAAASDQPGYCQFEVGNASRWYGQRIVNDAGPHTRRTPTVTIDDVLAHLCPLDYLHLDIQDAELGFLGYRPDLLDKNVRLINIGTHTVEIETELRKQFYERGWLSMCDLPMNSSIEIKVGDEKYLARLGDGVQVWFNPSARGA
jgi:FkbM family methyltransferase